MEISKRFVELCIFSLVMTAWALAFKPLFEAWIMGNGGAVGIGETFVGFLIPSVFASVLSYFLIWRLRKGAS